MCTKALNISAGRKDCGKVILVTKVLCERMDCKHWVDGECAKKEIEVKERTIPPDEEVAVCSAYKIVAAFC
jgi:hypothetical protein